MKELLVTGYRLLDNGRQLAASRLTFDVSRLTLYGFCLALLLVLATPVVAQTGATDDQVNEIAKEIYCPVCESTPLDVCPTQACADWRELIRTQLNEGWTKQQIFDYFAAQYGASVLARPPRQGLNLLLWVWPVIALGLGLVIFGRYLRNLRQTATPVVSHKPAVPSITPGSPEDYVRRVEEELQKG